MKPDQKNQILSELIKRLEKPKEIEGLSNHFFKQQLSFIDDKAKFKAALCTRRAGKSVACVGYLVKACTESPNITCVYGAMTRQSVKKIAWKELKAFDKKYNLKLHYNETELTARFPNGSEIICTGINDVTAAESLRGQHFKVIILDEAQSYGSHFRYIIEDVLTPTLIDDDGTLCMVGTPSSACTGPFYDATTGKDKSFACHKWGILDNPHIPHAEKWLKNYREKKGWSLDNPIYMREWLGTWIRSNTSMVYKYDQEKNTGVRNSTHKMHYIMGVDLGYDDATAFVVLGYTEDSPDLFVVDTFKKSKMIPSEIAVKIAEIQDKWQVTSTVCDTGGLGKSIVEEMKKRYGISIKPAQKKNKYEYIELINSDFYEGKIKIAPNLKELQDELSMLQFDEDTKKEDGRFENHLCDALLYAWRESSHYGFRAKQPKIVEGTESWVRNHIKELEESLLNADKSPWWEK